MQHKLVIQHILQTYLCSCQTPHGPAGPQPREAFFVRGRHSILGDTFRAAGTRPECMHYLKSRLRKEAITGMSSEWAGEGCWCGLGPAPRGFSDALLVQAAHRAQTTHQPRPLRERAPWEQGRCSQNWWRGFCLSESIITKGFCLPSMTTLFAKLRFSVGSLTFPSCETLLTEQHRSIWWEKRK